MSGKVETNKLENLEDIYPLSPMQQGMLFHTIYAPESGAYFEQSVFTIKGQLKVGDFERAWQTIVERHSILRSSFFWEDLGNPVQAVHRQVLLPIDSHDWTDKSAELQSEELAKYLVNDRDRGFDLGSAPLVRLALFRLSSESYKFVFSRHHLVLDRWSRSIVFNELFQLYDAYCQGEEPRLPQPRPYGDYIGWLAAQDPKAAESYWKSALTGISAPTELTVERKSVSQAQQGVLFADERIHLSEIYSERLKDFARQHKLTLNTLSQACWAILLSRYSREEDVVFGVTVAGRPTSLTGVESMVGLFINTLPLKVRVRSQAALLGWLEALQEQQGNLQEYEYSSLLDVQGWSEVPRGMPLFKNIFVFENLPVGSSHQAPGDLEFISDRGLGSATGYPLTVLVSPGARLTVQMVYDCARFQANTIRRMLTHFQSLLEGLPSAATNPIWRLGLLTAREREQILIQWNDTATGSAPAESIKSLFEIQVATTPESAALVWEDQELTYRELNERANQVAHGLQSLGVGPDVKVGICIQRGIEMMLGVLGTMKAGGTYVPLDPAYPAERLQLMLDDSQCVLLLTDRKTEKSLSLSNAKVVCLHMDWQSSPQCSENPGNLVVGENLAYVIYTSGSTGRPKGVGMPHRALRNLLSWQLAPARSFEPARTLQCASLSFDVSFQEIFSTWCSGGTLILVSDELRRDPASLLRFIDQKRIQRIFLPFVLLQYLAAEVEQGGVVPEDLREIITAGEQLEITPQIAGFCRRLKQCRLHNHYGPSESHVVTAHELLGEVTTWPTLPPIGKPIFNTQIYILDQDLEPTPIGIPGELCIGGLSLSRGYLNQADMTAGKFLPDPFGKEPGARIYKTGDFARFLTQGNIEFLGRIDNQVKIRGFRIELGEIEALLLSHPSVREAVVTAREDAKDDRRLAAYIVPEKEGCEALLVELREYLRMKLPDYMVPAVFVFLETMPLTPSGKINRRALPALDPNEYDVGKEYAAPQTLVEEKLCEIWSLVLRRSPIGRNDNFFDLGGHSLLATQLISRVRAAFKLELPLRQLFESPTVAGLSRALADFETGGTGSKPGAIPRRDDLAAEDMLANIDRLTEDQVDTLLTEALAERGGIE